ncbi:MAG: phage portal protein [Candidatus Pacebacteria bacterium]|nr:phage portal protein [Candidatus Paceibacterota bacterium]
MAEFDTVYSIPKQAGYEGATTSYRMEQKGLTRGDQDSVAARELQNLWARSHYLTRNNACSITAKKRLLANWIGIGITTEWTHANGDPHKKMQKLWLTWLAECNLDGYGNLYNTEALWGAALFESGESLTRMVVAKRPTSKIPLALQVLESEQLDPMFNNLASQVSPDIVVQEGETVTSGIGFVNTKPTTYYFWKRHPGKVGSVIGNNKRVPIPAEDIIHIFERERPGQWRGVPMLAAVLLNIYEMDELVDATLQRQKAAQAISWIIEKTGVTNAFAPGTVRASTDINEVDAAGNRKMIIQAAGGGVQYLNAGESVKFSSIDDIGANLQVLLQDEWSKIAAALGLAYHQITGDLSGVNFSSIRAGLNELRIRIEMVQQHLFINLGLRKVTARFQEFAGLYESAAMLEAIATFYVPRRYGVDDLKDAQADLMEVQAGFATLSSKLKERNITFEELLADRKKVEAAKLKISSFPETLAPSPATPTTNNATTKSDKSNPAKTKPETTGASE